MGKCREGWRRMGNKCVRILKREGLSEEQRKSYNRAIIVLVLGIFVTLWVLINSWEFITSAMIYIVIGVVCIALYFFWDKIKRFGT